ncbi:MAG: hypothetical protein JNM88_00680 [Chitinophagaceae bacterium]|nr:hypothetical protein [Chitinophagaceae bacterium]
MASGNRSIPPCPDPGNYVLVRTKEGTFWRRKRGTVKNAPVNVVLRKNNKGYKVLMPAVSRMLTLLKPYTAELSMGRITARWTGKLLKPFNETGKICLPVLIGNDLQPEYPFDSICHLPMEVMTSKQLLNIRLKTAKTIIKCKNILVNGEW